VEAAGAAAVWKSLSRISAKARPQAVKATQAAMSWTSLSVAA
jgi:hypothetical protein